MSKPILFCDFDGVLNTFPYKYHRINDEFERENYAADGLEILQHGANEYALQRYPIDEEQYFRADERFIAAAGNGSFIIHYSSEMVDRIRNLIDTGKIEFVWLSTWRAHTITLNEHLNFRNVSWLDWEQKMSDYNQVFKKVAIRDYFTENEPRPFIWLDDVATIGSVNFPEEDDGWDANPLFKKYDLPSLIIKPFEQFGISRVELDAIEKFVEDNS